VVYIYVSNNIINNNNNTNNADGNKLSTVLYSGAQITPVSDARFKGRMRVLPLPSEWYTLLPLVDLGERPHPKYLKKLD